MKTGAGVPARPVLITGGAGFIGTNLAARLLTQGVPVIVYDNLSRPGVQRNIEWLQGRYGGLVDFRLADIRDRTRLEEAVREAGRVYHFAAQVAVTTSVERPLEDFAINIVGSLNLLEAVRSLGRPVPVLFTSTNKVYGALEDVELRRECSRYEPSCSDLLVSGIDESRPLDFHSPYGCSKGSADQYFLDYARTYGIPATVFRMSCIYGPHQFGTEDQGWVAHFVIHALQGRPITLYGDGMQVRDILFVEDLVDAMLRAHDRIHVLQGKAFNIGGGPSHTVSLLELIGIIGRLSGRDPNLRFAEWRVGDQKYYVSNTRRFEEAAGWKARTGVQEGVERLYGWLKSEALCREELSGRQEVVQ